MNRKAIILSIKGFNLSKEEESLIKDQKPWGIILFKRNIKSSKQLIELTSKIRRSIRDPLYPILIDEEGGRVSRISKIIDTKKFSQNLFGKIYSKDKITGKYLYEEYLKLICNFFKISGININTIPVLDILKKNTHKIIGDRSYSNNIAAIQSLGKICINTLRKSKIGSVSKHIPGHGSSNLDSHKKTPIVSNSYQNLIKNDFRAFQNINSHFVMTAHIIYKKIDPFNVCTHSRIVISEIIRKRIGYKGLIMSDDISMKSLSKNLLYNANKAIYSGCNLVLYCGGNIKESKMLVNQVNKIDDFTTKKTSEFYRFLR